MMGGGVGAGLQLFATTPTPGSGPHSESITFTETASVLNLCSEKTLKLEYLASPLILTTIILY